MTVSGSGLPFLLWLNPDNEQDLKAYITNPNDPNTKDAAVGAFMTNVVNDSGDTIISTATINELNLTDIMSAGISCLDGVGNNQTLYVADAGRKHK